MDVIFRSNGEINDVWNAQQKTTSNGIEYIKNNGYNSTISPNSSVSFSYSVLDCSEIPDTFSLCQTRVDKADEYNVQLDVNETWGDNYFNGGIIIENNTSEPIEAWELTFDTNFTITEVTNSWSATVTELEDYKYMFKGTYTGTISPNSSVYLGFIGIKNGEPEISDVSLTEMKLNEELLTNLKFQESTETEDNTSIELLSFGTVSDDNIYIEWITNKEINNISYTLYESNDNSTYIEVSTLNETTYSYPILSEFEIKYFYVEAILNGECIGKSPAFYVLSENGEYQMKFIDTDGDGLSDYIESIIGTDINLVDTDGDGLNDYYEYFITGTDPLLADTDNNGITDDLEDLDNDGLTNLEEYINGTTPFNKDTDNDGLLDGEEINEYFTNPLEYDTDNDGINDYDEIKLGLNPNDSNDKNTFIKQTIDIDNNCLENINVEGTPFKLSMDIVATGCVETNLNANNSSKYNSIYSFDTINIIKVK